MEGVKMIVWNSGSGLDSSAGSIYAQEQLPQNPLTLRLTELTQNQHR